MNRKSPKRRSIAGRATRQRHSTIPRAAIWAAVLLLLRAGMPASAGAYVLNTVVADMRQPSSVSGDTACPQPERFDISTAGSINLQWSTSLNANPVTILTANQTHASQISEIASMIAQSYAVWTSVSGSALTSSSLGPLNQTSAQNACAVDGVNTICFNQSDPGFTTGVLAFARVVAADAIGAQAATGTSPATFIGQILDADILVNPSAAGVQFATPAALAGNASAYDLESILLHEIGQQFGFGNSDVWRAAMFPYATATGTYLGSRPTVQTPDAPLADDDRSAVRALYHNPSDNVYLGSIQGQVLPANPLALAGLGETGIFGAQVVAVNAATGAVEAAAISGWSCNNPGPPVFDGTYAIQGLAIGQSYEIYAEPLDGPVSAEDALAQSVLCRDSLSDPGWPTQFACTTPSAVDNFSVRILPGP